MVVSGDEELCLSDAVATSGIDDLYIVNSIESEIFRKKGHDLRIRLEGINLPIL